MPYTPPKYVRVFLLEDYGERKAGEPVELKEPDAENLLAAGKAERVRKRGDQAAEIAAMLSPEPAAPAALPGPVVITPPKEKIVRMVLTDPNTGYGAPGDVVPLPDAIARDLESKNWARRYKRSAGSQNAAALAAMTGKGTPSIVVANEQDAPADHTKEAAADSDVVTSESAEGEPPPEVSDKPKSKAKTTKKK